jgi:hypothetical protein
MIIGQILFCVGAIQFYESRKTFQKIVMFTLSIFLPDIVHMQFGSFGSNNIFTVK